MAERRESVRLELNDAGFSTGMVKNAAATGLLEKALKSLDGTTVTIHERISESATSVDRLSKSSSGADRSINQLTGRLRLFADAAAIFGPGAVPVGGVLAAGVAGFASQLGFAAIAGGVLVGSMQGVGDALSALNDAHLEPTAENLAKAEDALNMLSPAAANFSREAYGLLPVLRGIRDAGAEGLFPGLTDSLDDLERLAPVVANIFGRIGSAVGEIAADGAASLASDRWADFFDFIATEGPRALTELSSAVGDVTHGLAELWMAFTPLNNDFSGWLMDVAAGFDSWASGLAQTEGFREFVDYIRTTGPQVAETAGALANAVLQIVQAAASLGGPTLRAIEAVADAFAAIADSPIGPTLLAAASGMALLSRASLGIDRLSVASAGTVGTLKGLGGALDVTDRNAQRASLSVSAFAAAERDRAGATKAGLATLGKGAALAGGLAVASSGAADGLGLTNTASLALMGTVAGPWGAAIGGGIGLMLDWQEASKQAAQASSDFEASLETMSLGELNKELALANTLRTKPGIDEDEGDADRQKHIDLINAEVEARQKAAAEDARLSGQTALYRSLEAENDVLEKNIGLMQAKRDEALRGFSAETDYAAALMDSKKAIQENGEAWGLNTEKGLNNRRALEGQASAWNELNRSTEQSPAAFRKARNSLIDTAESMGASRAEARKYANQLLDIPSDLKTKIGLDVDTAMQRAKAIKSELASIDRNIDIYVNIRKPNASNYGPQITSADGATVPGQRYPYGDKVHAFLAPGEEVISNRNGQADRHRALLKDINANRLADGGTAGMKDGKSKRSFALTDTSAGLQAAIDRLTLVAEDQTRAVEDSTAKTEQWASRMEDAGNNTLSTLGLDLWGSSSDPWAAGSGSGPMFNLTNTNSGLEQRIGLQQQLADLGLSGEALSQLLTGTNAQISGVINRGEVGQYAQQFAQYQALSGAASSQAGQLAFGAQFEASRAAQDKATAAQLQATAAVTRMESKLAVMANQIAAFNNEGPERTGDAVGRVINGAAATGFRRGVNGGNR